MVVRKELPIKNFRSASAECAIPGGVQDTMNRFYGLECTVSTSKFERGVAGVERSEPPVGGISGGSLRSTPATHGFGTANLEVLTVTFSDFGRLSAGQAVMSCRSAPRIWENAVFRRCFSLWKEH